jgi:hypothetical protein
MTDSEALIKRLDFQLNIQSDSEGLLYDATLKARRVYDETIRLAKDGADWDNIPDDAKLVNDLARRCQGSRRDGELS